VVRQRHLPRPRIASTPASPEVDTVWCGALNGLCVTSAPLPSPLALWILVTSMRSSMVSGGRIPGILRASMVFPEPGGPLMIT
jgi:hypothetical protein